MSDRTAHFDRSFPLRGKVVLVTGAGSGIGAAIAQRAAAEGAAVALLGRTEHKLRAVAAALHTSGSPVSFHAVDLLAPEPLHRAVADLLQLHGGLDALVVNAALAIRDRTIEDTSEKQRRDLIAVNLESFHSLLRETLPLLRQRPGSSILAIASDLALRGMRGLGWYSATKGALLSLMRTLAVELGPDGIRVNALCPGLVRTPASMAQEAFETAVENYSARAPLGRIGEPEDIAGMSTFLIGPGASWITGQSIVLDGGYGIA